MIPADAVEAAAQFLSAYADRSGVTSEQALDGRVVSTCTCDYDDCEGFQLIPEYCVLAWRGETILIRGDDPAEVIETEARIRSGYADAFDEGLEAGRGLRPAENPYRPTRAD